MHADSAEESERPSKPNYEDDVRAAGPYRYVRFLAHGGMGRVDLALRNVDRFARLYAIKRLHPHLASDPSAREMFLEEARIGGLLSHPNVVGVIDFGDDRHGPYIVMDFVDGISLASLRALANKRGETLPIEICAAIMLAVARGLAAIHSVHDASGAPMKLLHRDLTPKNVLIGYDGSVRVTDFGIAKGITSAIRTTTGVLKGTVGYLAPERLKFDEPTPRADLFSLGVIAYELLTGERLFPGDAVDAARATLTAPAPDLGELRPDAPPALTELLFRLLAKDPSDRPESADEVVSLLESLVAQCPEPAALAPWVAMLAGQRRANERTETEAALQRIGVEAASARARSFRLRVVAAGTLAAIAVAGAIGVGLAAIVETGETAPAATETLDPPSPSETNGPSELARTTVVVPDPSVAPEPAIEEEPAEPVEGEPERARTNMRAGMNAAMNGQSMALGEGTPLEMTWTGEFR